MPSDRRRTCDRCTVYSGHERPDKSIDEAAGSTDITEIKTKKTVSCDTVFLFWSE